MQFLAFRNEILCRWVRKFLSNKDVKEGHPFWETLFFAAVDLCSVKTVTEKYRHICLL